MTDDDLIQADDYAFAFRRLEPVSERPRALLVLLHGVGGDERQLERLGARAPAGTVVVLPRGHRSISGGKWGWYRVGFSEDGPQIVEEEMLEALARLVEFVGQLQAHHDVTPERTWVGGFSQGGILAAAAAMTAPQSVAGFAMLSGRLLPEVDPLVAQDARLQRLQALVVHGREDEVLPVSLAREGDDRLAALGISHETHLIAGGHALGPEMEDIAAGWLSGRIGADKPEQLS
ncbi:alpha/beta hydrolase [Cognatilysobacter segetis]|uniref:alpha/beta hydrolase n=1 Tax=Cognatilysobacter segetis TaxID=2492394 RepID=UPI00138FDDFC|nr:alpha/beta fold hydrolase [Lysobacter segetis]